MTVGICPHGEFELEKGCSQCVAERRGTGDATPTVASTTAPDASPYVMPEEIRGVRVSNPRFVDDIADKLTEGIADSFKEAVTETALALRPGADVEVMSWHAEALKALAYANDRKVTNADEYALASDDLSLVSKLKKLMIAKRRELLDPLKAESDAIRETYTFLMDPVDKADQITRAKMTAYLSEQARIKAAQERINQLRMEAAQKEAALSGTGEITESVNLIPVQMDTPKSIKTALGSSGLTDHWTYEIIDISLIPREYMMPDTVLLNNTAKKYHDKKEVPGVRFINKPFMSNRASYRYASR